jgi:hypothetical protein
MVVLAAPGKAQGSGPDIKGATTTITGVQEIATAPSKMPVE